MMTSGADGRRVATWQEAELLAAEHMRSIGFVDADTTRAGADGGIDVTAADAVAQVKFHAMPVGAPDVQRLRGAAHQHKNALFYSAAGYTPAAIAYAEQAKVALYGIGPWAAITAVNQFAADLAEQLTADEVEERRSQIRNEALVRVQTMQASWDWIMANFQDLVAASGWNPDEQLHMLDSTGPFYELTETFYDALDVLSSAQLLDMAESLENFARNFAIALMVDYELLPKDLPTPSA